MQFDAVVRRVHQNVTEVSNIQQSTHVHDMADITSDSGRRGILNYISEVCLNSDLALTTHGLCLS